MSIFLVNSIAIFNSAQSQVDVEKLFHANPPSLSPNSPVSPQWTQPNPNDQNGEPSDTNQSFQVFRGPRHDEFDWSLTKVSKIYLYLIAL